MLSSTKDAISTALTHLDSQEIYVSIQHNNPTKVYLQTGPAGAQNLTVHLAVGLLDREIADRTGWPQHIQQHHSEQSGPKDVCLAPYFSLCLCLWMT